MVSSGADRVSHSRRGVRYFVLRSVSSCPRRSFTVPLPFRKVVKRRGVRRFFLPFTAALLVVGFVAFGFMAG